ELRAADWHLFVGDESAIPAIAALAEAIDVPAAGKYALVEVGDPSDEIELAAEVSWLHRGVTPPGTAELFSAALDGFSRPAGDGHAYLLGESRVVAGLRPRLNDLGLRNEQLYVKGYWNLGRAGLAW